GERARPKAPNTNSAIHVRNSLSRHLHGRRRPTSSFMSCRRAIMNEAREESVPGRRGLRALEQRTAELRGSPSSTQGAAGRVAATPRRPQETATKALLKIFQVLALLVSCTALQCRASSAPVARPPTT